MNILLGVSLAVTQVLFPVADRGTKPEGYDGATVRVEGGTAVVDVAANHKFSGVNFVFPEPFALNRYDVWCAEVSNRTDRTLEFLAHGIAKGTSKRFANVKFSLGPGESKVVKAPCNRKSYTVAPGSRGLPGMMGYDLEFRADHLDKSDSILSIIIFRTFEESPAQFDVKRLWVDGERPGMTLKIDDAFFPFVDEFGQFAHAEWPGKVHSFEEMKVAAKAAEAELAAHPESPIPGAYRFGGWGAGPQLKATGKFRTGEVPHREVERTLVACRSRRAHLLFAWLLLCAASEPDARDGPRELLRVAAEEGRSAVRRLLVRGSA